MRAALSRPRNLRPTLVVAALGAVLICIAAHIAARVVPVVLERRRAEELVWMALNRESPAGDPRIRRDRIDDALRSEGIRAVVTVEVETREYQPGYHVHVEYERDVAILGYSWRHRFVVDDFVPIL